MIEIRYSCGQCGLLDEKILVKARQPDQDVVAWMEQVTGEIDGHHSIASPRCTARKLDMVKIPVGKDAEGIGFEPVT